MIVEPASVHGPSPLRRLLRAAGLVAPVGLLLVVVAGGLLGSRPAPQEAVTASASTPSSLDASRDPQQSLPTTAPPAGHTSLGPEPDIVFPAAYLSLPAMLPSAVLAARASAGGPPPVVLAAGFLGMTGTATRCLVPGAAVGAWCDRPGVLSEAPSTVGSPDPPPHLHVVVPAGVVLPTDVWDTGTTYAGSQVPVLVLGRFAQPGPCGGGQACEQGFVVERVVWSDGRSAGVEALREPGQGPDVTTAALARARTLGVPILAVLGRPTTIARLDPSAARALAGRSGLVWYLREVSGTASAPTVDWLLLDVRHGTRIAGGPSSAPPVPIAPTAFAPPRD